MTRTSTLPARTYQVRTYGCQMDVQNSERLAGLLKATRLFVSPRTGKPT